MHITYYVKKCEQNCGKLNYFGIRCRRDNNKQVDNIIIITENSENLVTIDALEILSRY